eukprot:TRINITY_DN49901_c0_g1_i1.p1 TRINITY_DN49901_c0_g1~~TRINITY_DN49901_c0_g1_i1.p1  ORF type:complete len:107 (+),score=10.88 TRINITY_DN49901_c0_g1_i1:216-536(+)
MDILKRHNLALDVSTIVLLDEAGPHTKTRAAFRTLPYFGFPYTCLYHVCSVIPTCVLDPVYDFIGRNRGTVSKYWPFKHNIEEHTNRMLGLEGKSMAQACENVSGS